MSGKRPRDEKGSPPKRPPPKERGVGIDDDSEEDEEEPEGEDLFGDEFLRDYANPEEEAEEDEVASSAASFLEDDDASLSEVSEAGRREVDALLDRRHNLEDRLLRPSRRRRLDDDGDDNPDSEGSDADDEEFEEMSEGESGADEDGEGSAEGRRRRSRRSRVAGDDAESNSGLRSHSRQPNAAGGRRSVDEAGVNHGGCFFEGDIPGIRFDWSKPTGDVLSWLTQEAPRRVVKNRIFNFFLNFVEGGGGESSSSGPTSSTGKKIYVERVYRMASENACSIEVSFMHLAAVYDAVLALWLIDCPEVMLELFNEAMAHLVYQRLLPQYRKVHPAVFVRITDVPNRDSIRGFRQSHRNVLVRVEGVVTRRSPVYPQLKAVRYDCTRCAFVIGPLMQRSDREMRVSACPSCQSHGPFRVNVALTEYRNHQTLVLQEPPGSVPAGRLPRSLEVVVTDDLIDRAKPGEKIDVTGICKNTFDPLLNHRQGFPVFTTILVANSISRRGGGGDATSGLPMRMLSDERERLIALSRHPKIKAKLVRSMAPSIHGHEDIKLGLLLVLMGGVGKEVQGERAHRIRGDINALIVGDPGCAKSQFLKFLEKTADRAVFTTGRGTTAVGLTAAVHKDPITGDFALEGGAMVIADRGVCLIDEFDKMSDQDRTSIHEAMEQQTISVARGGIVTSLSARCSVVAAANPVGGRYDPSLSFDANVDLTTPILSRFDLLFVVRDEVNAENDMRLASFVCRSHRNSHPERKKELRDKLRQRDHDLLAVHQALNDAKTADELDAAEERLQQLHREALSSGLQSLEDTDPSTDLPLEQRLLRSYLSFAKTQCRPSVANVDANALSRLYTDLRQESKHGGVPITVRHLESMIRLSEAHARLHLREFVTDDDVTAATALFLRCFMGSQKYSQRSALEAKFRRYLESDIEPQQLLHYRLTALVTNLRTAERRLTGVEPTSVTVECSEFETSIAPLNIAREALSKYYASPLFTQHYDLVPSTGAGGSALFSGSAVGATGMAIVHRLRDDVVSSWASDSGGGGRR